MNPIITSDNEEHNVSVPAQMESADHVGETERRDKRFGYMMRRERMTMGLTQSELGELLGISTSYVSSIERGKRGASGTVLKKMHDAFKISYDYMLGSSAAAVPEPAFAVHEDTAPYGDAGLSALLASCSRQELDVCYRLCRAYLMSKES
ncbi:MAG: helix-turn-helix transcriptional regulator [Lachnospiraceae bacterium]|nr:helix-turn-helix transcriptional regulator [Lachnospiraceae bacterium]